MLVISLAATVLRRVKECSNRCTMRTLKEPSIPKKVQRDRLAGVGQVDRPSSSIIGGS